MLKPPKVGGAGQLRLFVDELGFDWSCQTLDIHPSTMRGWLRDARPAPQAALQALYWLTNYGFSDACAEAHWSHQYLVFKVRELEGRLERLRSARSALAGHEAVDASMGLLSGIMRGGGPLMQTGQIGPNGGIAAGASAQGDQNLQEEFSREVH